MNATGKKMRLSTGLTRHELHFSSHARKSPAKRKAMGWGKSGKLTHHKTAHNMI